MHQTLDRRIAPPSGRLPKKSSHNTGVRAFYASLRTLPDFEEVVRSAETGLFRVTFRVYNSRRTSEEIVRSFRGVAGATVVMVREDYREGELVRAGRVFRVNVRKDLKKAMPVPGGVSAPAVGGPREASPGTR